MTDLRKAAEMALDALERSMEAGVTGIKVDEAITSLRQALAPKELPRPDEPIWVVDEKGNKTLLAKQNRAPPKREWVGLTDEEMTALKQKSVYDGMTRIVTDYEYIRSIEAKLKEKNT